MYIKVTSKRQVTFRAKRVPSEALGVRSRGSSRKL